MRRYCVFALAVLCVPGCKKDEGMPVEPAIEMISMGPTDVEEFTDVVKLRFSYKDGNGDLGYADPDVLSLRVKDSRLPEPDWYHIPLLAPEDATIAIQGELEVTLNPLFLLGNGSQEQATFSIRLEDRAGNWSNELVSPVILIHDSL